MFEFSSQQSQMMLLAGVVLLGWILIRRQLKTRHRQLDQDRSSRDFADRLGHREASPGVPLASAPPETQRWHTEMFELQRELKAELDMKIAVVQVLLRQADEKINQLAALRQK